MKATVRERVVAFNHSMDGDLEFISGKWFYKHKEIKNPRKFFLISMQDISTTADLQECMDMYIALFGTEGKWYPLKIIDEARQQAKLKPLCFPLNKQQLTIIRKLLDNDEEVCFISTGVGGSGKSTFLNIVKQIFDGDVSSCALSDLNGFNTAEALQHRLIASDELSADDLDNKTLKTIISKQLIQVNPKFEKPYQVMCQSALFYCCNIPPRIDLDDTGLLRRIVYYEMNQKIKNPDVSLNRREWTHDDLVNIVAHALALDVTNWFEDFKDTTHEYLLKNNSVFRYKQCKEYWEYKSFCNDANLKAYSEPKWQTIKALIKEWGMDGEIIEKNKEPEGASFIPLSDEELPF